MNDAGEVTRTRLHERVIRCSGYRRSDGLYDVEATLSDVKTVKFFNHERGEIPAGEPIHEMVLTVTFNLDMEIVAVRAGMPWTPFRICPRAADRMQKLVGLRIASGWMKEVKARVPNHDACTHLIELLTPVCTTAYQTMHEAIEERENARRASRQSRPAPAILGQCHALQPGTEVARGMWPELEQD